MMRFNTLIKQVKDSNLYKKISDKYYLLSPEDLHLDLISKAIFMHTALNRANLSIFEYKLAKYNSMADDSFNSWYDEHIADTIEDHIVNMLIIFIYLYYESIEYSGNISTYFGMVQDECNFVELRDFIVTYSQRFSGSDISTDVLILMFKRLLRMEILTYSDYENIESIVKHKIKYYE